MACSGASEKISACPDVEGVGVGSLEESDDGALKVPLEVRPSPKVRLAGSLASGMGNLPVFTSGRWLFGCSGLVVSQYPKSNFSRCSFVARFCSLVQKTRLSLSN